ncbi:hypothetical protein BSLA_02r0392 [Burkholderia stabilis]|nr:hypothetical protein BSLA_02r0392 [Burkholderia stabilis]
MRRFGSESSGMTDAVRGKCRACPSRLARIAEGLARRP